MASSVARASSRSCVPVVVEVDPLREHVRQLGLRAARRRPRRGRGGVARAAMESARRCVGRGGDGIRAALRGGVGIDGRSSGAGAGAGFLRQAIERGERGRGRRGRGRGCEWSCGSPGESGEPPQGVSAGQVAAEPRRPRREARGDAARELARAAASRRRAPRAGCDAAPVGDEHQVTAVGRPRRILVAAVAGELLQCRGREG